MLNSDRDMHAMESLLGRPKKPRKLKQHELFEMAARKVPTQRKKTKPKRKKQHGCKCRRRR